MPFLLQSSSEPVLYGIGLLWDGVIYLFTLVLIVSFPTGRLDGWAERAIVAAGAVSVPALLTVIVLIAPTLGGGVEDRLGAVRGRLVITTSPGNGTLISGVVPISAPVP